jgi:hypothetical protein
MPETVEQRPDLTAWKKTVARLPLTLRPILNEQISQWEMLFPFEQAQLQAFLLALDLLSPQELADLTAPLRELESKMDVRHWEFNEASNTVENAATLARSAYYGAWRREIQRFTEAINDRCQRSTGREDNRKRLVLLVHPRELPLDEYTAWGNWQDRGRQLKIAGNAEDLTALVMNGKGPPGGAGILGRSKWDIADLWFIDAGEKLSGMVPNNFPAASLSYSCLKPFRDKFLAQLNTMPKSITAADRTLASLRKMDWTQSFPADMAGNTLLQKFVIDVFLSGNGALIFSNPFVEWSASEAIRRARPQLVVARFGMRNKPKPFTSIAIFENQEQVSTVEDAPDPENSSIDAAILAFYVWLAANRYPEYEDAACLCISEHLSSVWAIAPPGSKIADLKGSVSPATLYSAVSEWFTS